MRNEYVSNLISYVKVCGQNLSTLHRHLVGGNWFDDHELLGDYYEKIGEFEDSIVEAMLSLGFDDVSILEAGKKFMLLENRDYESAEAFKLARSYFVKLDSLLNDVVKHCSLPAGINSEFENMMYWLEIEANYKLKRFLSSADLGYLFKEE